jgi:hypothetical protein
MTVSTGTRDVTDDEVLQAMDKIGLDAGNLVHFRATRHYLNHGVPLCCIAFGLRVVEPIKRAAGYSLENAERLIKKGKPIGIIFESLFNYWDWCPENPSLHYTPCPACLISGTFVEIPAGCPCCADKKLHPPPGEALAS